MKILSTIPCLVPLFVGLAGGSLAAPGPARAGEPAAPGQAAPAALSPPEVQARLSTGNARFVAGKSRARDWALERARTAQAQSPAAMVLGCIDSRVPGEVIFDQGLGEIFSARVAGNVVDDDLLGSMEFACQVAGARLIAVVGGIYDLESGQVTFLQN